MLFVGGHKKLIVPESATVVVGKDADKLVLELEKRLSYAGHPPMNMSIREERKKMGCAVKSKGDALVLGIYGELYTFEGGWSVAMTLHSPPNIVVEWQAGLAWRDYGEEKRGGIRPKDLGDLHLTKIRDGIDYYWIPPVSEKEWQIIPFQPNPKP